MRVTAFAVPSPRLANFSYYPLVQNVRSAYFAMKKARFVMVSSNHIFSLQFNFEIKEEINVECRRHWLHQDGYHIALLYIYGSLEDQTHVLQDDTLDVNSLTWNLTLHPTAQKMWQFFIHSKELEWQIRLLLKIKNEMS